MNVVFIIPFLLIRTTVALHEGDDCTLRGIGTKGTCIGARQCPYARQQLKMGQIPQHCGYKKQKQLVCCPKKIIEKTISDEKCEEYHDKRNIRPSVAQGEKALLQEFPHMAAVGYENRNTTLWLCGGSLISEQFVISAAHCAKSRDFGVAKWVRLGDLDLNSTTDDANPENFKITEIYVYPNYKSYSHYSDIALFKLENVVEFGIYIRPICLHTELNLPVNKLQVTGWGKTDFHGGSSTHLMKATLNLVPHKRCNQTYSTVSRRKLANGIVDVFQICAGDSSGKDTCPGDSGGPLQFYRDDSERVFGHYVLVGITSFGKGCGTENSVGVYTRVSPYKTWIENIVWLQGL